MDIQRIVQAVDHTLLKVESTWEDVKVICDDALEYDVASICIPPSFVKDAVDYLDGQTAVCTVIGFPNGYSRTNIKVEETKQALLDGASEIDMVINVGDLKARKYAEILAEIKAVKEACGDKILKVIIETCLLTNEEIIKMCEIVTESGADFIKTSTGFSTAGAKFEDVKIMSDHVGPNVRVKAAGGISSLADAEKFLELGASRLGTSRIVKILKEEK